MSEMLEYKGYIGSIDRSKADRVYYGKVLGVDALISYDGATIAEAVKCFHDMVDYYLSVCEESGTEPERPFRSEAALIEPHLSALSAQP